MFGEKISSFNDLLNNNTNDINWKDILCPSVIGIVLAFILSYIENSDLVNRFGRVIRATNHSRGDVWTHWMNLKDLKKNGWVYVRDHENKLVYYGWVRFFSEENVSPREIFLDKVEVYDESGNLLYQIPAVYLNRCDGNITIELPRFFGSEVQHVQERSEGIVHKEGGGEPTVEG